ncbi:FAD-dependent monooxygenase [Streptomyces sp. NBC_00588]|uniref:FAD-dependent monooxygenase n=1 Tax=Streptomyces sp. NBC_00588 TaxID=2975784 RepID=UPI002E821702|nr:FAD-dependent monooxygenase [Streptomyces sp. NBC_00588]WUB36807.1 FAD-dependent monooxygenase [Streptomyces sp. NBC_00588]
MSVEGFEQEHSVRSGERRAGASGPRVLVAGASVAGPALAHWLRRWGAEVTVVERAPELRPGGQAVDARGVAKEVIARMGLDAAVRAACTDTAGAHTVDADGRVLETFRADDDAGDGFIADIEILRGDLSRVLYDHTRDGVEYVFGDRIAELTQDADGVDVTFESGDRRRFDLVVGADGLHSELRAMVFGPPERFLRHLGHVLAFYSVPNVFGLDRWLLEYQDQDSGRSVLLRPIQDATRAMAMFYLASADFDVDHRDVAAQKVLLRERMAGLGWLTPDILAHLDDTPDFYLDQVAQVVMDRWSSGRVGLLGDAAFSSSPMSGQGTGLALVGAYVLAGELAAAGWDPGTGFARYEARMRSFVEANQEIGRLNARSRDVPGPDAEPRPDFAGAWFTELVGRAINGVELPDYAVVPDTAASR